METLLLLLVQGDAVQGDSMLVLVENIAILALTLLILCSSCRRCWWSLDVVPVAAELQEIDIALLKAFCLSEVKVRSILPLELEDDFRLNSSDEDDGF